MLITGLVDRVKQNVGVRQNHRPRRCLLMSSSSSSSLASDNAQQSVYCAGPRWRAECYKCDRGYSLGNRRVTHRGEIVAITATTRRVRPAACKPYRRLRDEQTFAFENHVACSWRCCSRQQLEY